MGGQSQGGAGEAAQKEEAAQLPEEGAMVVNVVDFLESQAFASDGTLDIFVGGRWGMAVIFPLVGQDADYRFTVSMHCFCNEVNLT